MNHLYARYETDPRQEERETKILEVHPRGEECTLEILETLPRGEE